MFHLVGIFKTSSPEDSILNNPEKHALRRQRKEPGNIEVSQQKADSLNIKRLLLITENQTSQIKEFSSLLSMGRCKRLGSLKSFLWYAPQLSGASFLCFSHPESLLSSGLTIGIGCSLKAARWQVFSFLSSLRAQWLTLEDCYHCWLWHPCLLIWQEIF